MTPQPVQEESSPLPLINAKVWAIGFLIFAIVLGIVLALTMPSFMADAAEQIRQGG